MRAGTSQGDGTVSVVPPLAQGPGLLRLTTPQGIEIPYPVHVQGWEVHHRYNAPARYDDELQMTTKVMRQTHVRIDPMSDTSSRLLGETAPSAPGSARVRLIGGPSARLQYAILRGLRRASKLVHGRGFLKGSWVLVRTRTAWAHATSGCCLPTATPVVSRPSTPAPPTVVKPRASRA
jgi:hypothetical protein